MKISAAVALAALAGGAAAEKPLVHAATAANWQAEYKNGKGKDRSRDSTEPKGKGKGTGQPGQAKGVAKEGG